jgi:hypothetical protein
VSDGVEHAADLTLAAFVENHLQLRKALVGAPELIDLCLGSLTCLAGQCQTTGEPVERVRIGRAFDCHVVGFPKPTAGVGDFVDKIAVVGEQYQPLRVGVEAPRGLELDAGDTHQINDFLLRMGIADGGDVAGRLVEGDIAALTRLLQALAIDRDLLGCRIYLNAHLGNDYVVYFNPATCNELLGATARGHPGIGDGFLETNGARRGLR